MTSDQQYTLSGIARPKDAATMLDEICEHFVEHAEVQRSDALALLKGQFGIASIRIEDKDLRIDLICPSEIALQMSRTSIAEHLFYFAGEDPFELNWAGLVSTVELPDIHAVTVTAVEDITPHMRRLKVFCADVAPFIGGDMHVRIVVPPKGRKPVWPRYREDGRVAWPIGEDELLVRVYTIRAVDAERHELWIDVLQHPIPGIKTPGADFARDCVPGDRFSLLGPGGGGLPMASHILLAGDESALPAIARIIAEVPDNTYIQAIIEVQDAREKQPLPTAAELDVRWLYRNAYADGARAILAEETKAAIAASGADTFVWVACEKEEARSVRSFLKGRKHDRKKMYVAWYWERHSAQTA